MRGWVVKPGRHKGLFSMVYENCKIYGPYFRKDGRQHVVLIHSDGRKQTVSYPRFLTEKRLGRYLLEDETIDHLDNNFNNNVEENIRIVSRREHVVDDVIRHEQQSFICPECGIMFSPDMHEAVQARKKGKAGPFCSKSCSGRYGQRIQTGSKKLEVKQIRPKYTTKKLSRLKETLERE
jgi:hypothetical protein